MRSCLFVCLFLLGLSCSHYKSLVGVDGVERMKVDQKHYKQPEFFMGEMLFEKNSRSPASVGNPPRKNNFSNRQIYFLGLYEQYRTMAKILEKKGELLSCPSFHNVIVQERDFDDIDIQSYSVDIDFSNIIENKDHLFYYPILAMPYSESQDLYSALERNSWKGSREITIEALQNYYNSTKKEVNKLCDTGASPGYYTYENLVNYFKTQKKHYGTKKGLISLLKIPVLANMMILDNLEMTSHSFRTPGIYDRWVLQRTNAQWFERFLSSLRKKRQGVLLSSSRTMAQ